MNRKFKINWQIIYIQCVLIIMLAVFVGSGYEGANLTIHNNLDRYIPMYKVLKDNHAFFSQNKVVPIYGYIGRDFLPSELKLQTILYYLFPTYIAYFVTLFLRIILAVIGVSLWFRSMLGERYNDVKGAVFLAGFVYGLMPVIPYYGLAYASIPWLLFFLDEFIEKKNNKFGIALVIYPIFSEFQSFGILIVIALLVYTCVSYLGRKEKMMRELFASFLLFIGYLWTEYRFLILIFDQSITLKSVFDSVLFWKMENLFSDFIMVIGLLIVLIFYSLLLVEDEHRQKRYNWTFSIIYAVGAIAILCVNTPYNDFINTIHPTKNSVSYKDYYAENFYSDLKETLPYYDQYVYSCGIDSAILTYNGIRNLEGSTSTIPDGEDLYYERLAKIAVGTENFDVEKLKDESGRYIFSNRELQETESRGLELVNSYTQDNGMCSVYIYRTESRYHEKEHSDIAYDKRVDLNYDQDEFEAIANEIAEILKKDDLKECDRVESLYKQMFTILQGMKTLYSMKDIDSRCDVTNQERMDETSKIYEDYLSMNDRAYQTLRDIGNSSYRSVLEKDYNDTEIDVLVEYEDMTEEEKERRVKLNELKEKYEQAAYEEYPIEYNDETWTFDTLNEAADELESNDAAAIYNALYKKRGEEIGAIYLEIRDLENEIAKEEGYKNYMEYAYEGVFARDYSIRDAKRLFKELKKKGKTDYAVVKTMGQKLSEYSPHFFTEDDTKTFEFLYPYINTIDPELGNSMRHLLDCGLYNLKQSPTKAAMGYTTTFPSYGDAYIFDSPSGTAKDFFTYVHEFGHYNAAYYMKEDLVFGEGNILDVCEIQSQGLEMLMAPKYHEMFDENQATYLEYSAVDNLLYAVYSAACQAEFEIYAYEHPDTTIEELSEEYRKLHLQYGFGVPMGSKQLYSWVDISHFFENPGYYISYATSAFGALQLYQIAKLDYNEAVEKYMEISTIGPFIQYCEAMNLVNLENPFDKDVAGNVVKEVCDDLKTMLRAYN